MSIFPKDVEEKAQAMNKAWIKAAEFEVEGGLTLKLLSAEKEESKYGAQEDSKMVELGLLEEGQTFRYTFEDSEGTTRKMDSPSMPFFIGIKSSEAEAGDWVRIYREGTANKTRYFVKKVSAPVSSQKKSHLDDDFQEVAF